MSTIADMVKAAIVEDLGVDDIDVTCDALLRDDLGADSMDLVALAQGLETALGVVIPDDEMFGWTTVGQVVASFESRRVKA